MERSCVPSYLRSPPRTPTLRDGEEDSQQLRGDSDRVANRPDAGTYFTLYFRFGRPRRLCTTVSVDGILLLGQGHRGPRD